MTSRKPYPSDVTDQEWAFVAPYLTLMTEDAPQRVHSLREIFNALRWMVRAGASWRMIPHDLPPWHAVHQQALRWIRAGVFENIVHDLRAVLRLAQNKEMHPSVAVFDSQTIQSTPESGDRAGYDAGKKKKGTKIHMAVDTLGNLLSLHTSPANEQDRKHVEKLSQSIQDATEDSVEKAFGDQGYSGEQARKDAAKYGVELEIVKLSSAKKGFVVLPKRWIVERSFAWKTRFRRLAKDYEQLSEVLTGFHFVAFAMLMLSKFTQLLSQNT